MSDVRLPRASSRERRFLTGRSIYFSLFLVLDGQQRLTSLYQAFYGVGEHRYYLDLNKLLNGNDFEDAIFQVRASTKWVRAHGSGANYLNNTIEQDHRRVKHRLGPMLGLKSFRTAAVVISGIELAEKIKKGQFQIGKLGGPTATMPEIWRAAVAA